MKHPCIYLLTWYLWLPPPKFTSSAGTQDVGRRHRRPRRLAPGDFADLNALLRGAVLRLPDASFSRDGADLTLSDVRCEGLSVGDLELTSRRESATSVGLELDATDLDMRCRAKYSFRAWWLFGGGGSGTADIASAGSDARLGGRIGSPDFERVPPEDVEIIACDPRVNIDKVEFSDGGIFGSILNMFRGLLGDFIESQAGGVVCAELRGLIKDAEGLLRFAKERLDEYEPNGLVWDPLSVEGDRMIHDGSLHSGGGTVDLLNFGDEGAFARWMESSVNQVVRYLSSEAEDPATGTADMQANILLRQKVLDEIGGLEMDSSDLSSSIGSATYEGHNRIATTSIRFDKVRMVGLDSLTSFNPLDNIGNYTHQSQFSWRYLGFRIHATVEMTPSTRPDSIIEAPGGTRIEERVEVFLGFDDVAAEMSIFSLFDKDRLRDVRLGSLLERDDVLPCLLSTVRHADVASFSVDVADLLGPTMAGFVSPGLDRLFASGAAVGSLLYEGLVLRAARRYFQEEVRPILAERFVRRHVGAAAACGPPDRSASASERVDFRDLLLTPDEALDAGATGREPYGNVLSSFAMPYMKESVLRGDSFNSDYIGPFTESQSGTEGSLVFTDTLFRHEDTTPSLLYDSLVLRVSDLRIHNLNTVIDPMDVLHPVDWNALSSKIALDGSGKELTVEVQIAVEIGGNPSPLGMQNILDLSLSIPSSALSFEIMANLKESSLMNFSVFDVTNYHCWLASLDDSTTESLVLSELSLYVESFQFGSACLSCSSPGMAYLSEIIHELEVVGFNTMFHDDVISTMVHMITDYANSFDIGALIDASHKHCPHHPSYNPEADAGDFSWPGLPALGKESSQTLLAIGMVALQSAMIGTAKNQLLLEEEDGAGPNITSQMIFPEGSRIVNWTSLDKDLGDWAGIAFAELRNYLTGPAKATQDIGLGSDMSAKNLQANELLREHVLDSDGVYTLNFDRIEFAALDMELALTKMKVYGLDSILALDLLVPSSPQGLKNFVRLEVLTITFEVDILSSGEAKTIAVSYEFQDITAELDFDLALDLVRLEDIQLGSIFNTRHLLPCAISGINSLESSTLDFRFQAIGDPQIRGYFSNQTHQDVQHLLNSLFDSHRADLINGLPLVINSTLRDIANTLSPEVLDAASGQCGPPTSSANSTGIIDFRDLLLTETLSSSLGGRGNSLYGNLFRTVYYTMQRKVLQSDASNRPIINKMLRKFTNGSLSFPEGNSFEESGRIQIAGLDAVFGVTVSDVVISGLDSVGDPLKIFSPVVGEANVVNNTVSFGVDSKPVIVSGKLALSFVDNADIQMRNELVFEVSLEVVLMASVLLKIVEGDLATFPLRDLNNIHCWLSMVLPKEEQSSRQRGIGLVDHSLSVGNSSLSLSCSSCTSPRFVELLSSLYNFSSPDAIDSIQDEVSDLLDTDLIQVFLDHVVDSSASKCPHRPQFDPNAPEKEFLASTAETLARLQEDSAKKPIYFTVSNSMIAGFVFILGILFRWTVDLRNKKWIESLSREGHMHLKLQQEKEQQMIDMIHKTTTSLFKSDTISKRVRCGVPVVLAVNLGLLLVAHFGILYTVDIEASLAGEEFMVKDFLKCTFIESTTQTFENGGAELVILIWIFTVIWPYVKIFLSLAMWLVPPQRLGIENRGRVLLWIDAAATLSVIGIFTVIVAIALLLVFVGGHDESYTSEDMLYSLRARIIPGAGFYCMIIAQRISRTSSRFFCEYHDQVISKASEEYESRAEFGNGANSDLTESQPDEEPENSLSQDAHICDGAIECEASIIRSSGDENIEGTESTKIEARWGLVGVYFGAVTIMIVFIIGAIFAPSISLDSSSAAALIIESDLTFKEVAENYGVFLVVSGVLLKARFVFDDTSNYVGFGLLLFAGVASICGVLIIRGYKFIRRKMKQKGSELPSDPSLPAYTRITRWKYIEIYVISSAVGLWQLGAICSYCVYLYCDILNSMFAAMALIGLAEKAPAQCYNIQASLPDNLGIIVGSFFVLLASFIFQAYSQYKKNISESLRWIDNDDVHHLSQVWSRSKKREFSFIASSHTASMSWDSTRDSTSLPSGSPETRNEEHTRVFELSFSLHNLWKPRLRDSNT